MTFDFSRQIPCSPHRPDNACRRNGLAGVLFAIGLLLWVTSFAMAAPPHISNISPSGVQKGVACELTITGANLAGNPRLVASFACRTEPVDPKRSSAGAWTFRITVAPEVALGVYPVRAQTDDGLSGPFLLAVGQLPQVNEKEDNSTFESAQSLPALPLVVEGQAAGNDVDYFKFAGKKGQTLVVDAQCARIGSGVDPSIRLTTASGSRRFVASADDSPGLLTDARMVALLPENAEYVVEISDSRYQGGGRPVYRLMIGEVPLAEEVFPLGGREAETLGIELRGGTLKGTRVAAVSLARLPGTALDPFRISAGMIGLATAGGAGLDVESLPPLVVDRLPELREPADPAAAPLRAVAPVVFNGRIDPPGDEDRFSLAVSGGQRLRIAVEASQHGSALDGVLQVVGPKGSVISTADDTSVSVPGQPAGQGTIVFPDPSLDLSVPEGTNEVALVLRDLEDRGGVGYPYRIVVTPVVPSFELNMNDAQVSIPRGGTAAVGVTVVRKDYGGPIELTVTDPPPGVIIRQGTIAAGQAVGALSISAAHTANFEPTFLKLVGRGRGDAGEIEVMATKKLVFAQQATLPTNSLMQHGLAVAPAVPSPVSFEAPAGPIEVAHGFGTTIPIKAVRSKGADAALAISALPLPPGIAVPATTIAAKAGDGDLAVNTALEAPLGLTSIACQAKGKLAAEEETISVPLISVNVVRPAEISVDAKTVELRAGTTVEVKGKVKRKGAFKGSVSVKANGLPPGLKADPVTVAAGKSEFSLKLVADAKAAAGVAALQVLPAFQVNKKDYPAASVPLAVKMLSAK
jgi:hypothetical protein